MMNVTFNQDEKTATDDNGKVYTIKGLIIRKPKEIKDAFYEPESSMCRAVVFKGITSEAVDIGNGEIHLL